MTHVAAALCGLLFGFGLIVSEMAQPLKVLNFLDVLGRWDPSLAFVMPGALLISGLGYWLAKRQPRPLVAAQWNWPTNSTIDTELIGGAALFGLGWGMVGLCPGPALVNILTLNPKLIGFVIAMAAGMVVCDWWREQRMTRIAVAADG